MAALAQLDPAALGVELERPDAPPLLLDFWASWCGTCRLQEPAVARVADNLGESLRVAAIDIEAHPEVADGWGVECLPTLLLVTDGAEVMRITQFHGEAALTAALAPYLEAA